ncbi:MAG TPA: cytochrome d ubiquinol oxidase subunit II [Solirubrobacteraceae bacterium]|jgi:cytochrome d ubiquinol oxidase subunit II|nr:cytochrome d ubiquinol oxidase subunit II [Solirubrobacteraceae bacterium]
MHLYEIPMICVLVGLALYAVLGGADFGAGLWQLATFADHRRSTIRATRIREHAHHSMGPVWEANHVWLIFILTVTWTAYPTAFGAIASTLAVPLLIAGLGVVFRGAAYALRAGTAEPRELARIDTVFALSSILTPFALGAMIGAIASGRVPVGNARGGLFSSWLNPTSALTGVLAIAVGAYLAAVYLAADADRGEQRELADAFRARALLAALLAGAVAIAGLAVLHSDAHRIFTRLTGGPGLVGLVISVAGGLATVSLVVARRYALARVSAALAVTGMIVGWALAQQPVFLPHLTLQQAAAPHESLVLVLVAIAMGAAILFPSLGLLFGLLLGGRFDHSATLENEPQQAAPRGLLSAAKEGLRARLAFAGLLGGLGFLTAAEAPWAHAVGVVCLFAAMILAFLAVDPARIAAVDDELPVRPLRRPGR